MYLLALCWYFQPNVFPILAFLALEFTVKLLQRQSQIHLLVRSDAVPEKLQLHYDPVTYEKCRRYTLRCCVLECMSLILEQTWKAIEIYLGTALFDLALITMSSTFVILRENLQVHWLTLEIFFVTALFTLCKRFFFLYKSVFQKLIDEKYHLSVQTWDSFIHHFIIDLGLSALRNSFLTALFVEISSIGYDLIGYTWPSLISAYLVTFVGITYSYEWYFKNNFMRAHSEDLKIVSEADGSLYHFITLIANRNGFKPDSIYVSDSSLRTSKINISFKGLMSPKIIVSNNLLEKYQTIFNPPVRQMIYGTLQEPTNESQNANDARNENVPEINDGSEILSLVSVQLAHWANNDNWALEIFQIGYSLLNLTLLSFIFMPGSVKIISEFCHLEEATAISLFATELLLLHWAKDHVKKAMQREYELDADSFAVQSGYGSDLRKALMEIYSNNLTFPLMDRFYELKSDRNSLISRIEAIDRESAQCADAQERKLQVYSIISL